MIKNLFSKDWWKHTLNESQLLDIDEITIKNNNISTQELYNYYIEYIELNNNEFDAYNEGYREYQHLVQKYGNPYSTDFPQQARNAFYRELQQLVKKYTTPVNEITIKPNPKVWDLDKPGVKFENVKIGDILQFTLHSPKDEIVQQKVYDKDERLIRTKDLDKNGNVKENALDWWQKISLENAYKTHNLDEITIQNNNINVEKLTKYWNIKIKNNDVEFFNGSKAYDEVTILIKKYWDEYHKFPFDDYFPQQARNAFYKELQQLVKKHTNPINEITIKHTSSRIKIFKLKQSGNVNLTELDKIKALANQFINLNLPLQKVIGKVDPKYVLQDLESHNRHIISIEIFQRQILDTWFFNSLNKWFLMRGQRLDQIFEQGYIDLEEINKLKEGLNEITIKQNEFKPYKKYSYPLLINNQNEFDLWLKHRIYYWYEFMKPEDSFNDYFERNKNTIFDLDYNSFITLPKNKILKYPLYIINNSRGGYRVSFKIDFKTRWSILCKDLINIDKDIQDELRPIIKDKTGLFESKNQNNNLLFKEFIKLCCAKLDIKQGDLKIKLSKDKQSTTTFAHFDPNKPEVVVYIKDRNILDSMRSLAHELKHYKQYLNNELTSDSGKDGSQHENEANSFAGEVLREFGRQHPELYTQLINEITIKSNHNITQNELADYIIKNIMNNSTNYLNYSNSEYFLEYRDLENKYKEKYGKVWQNLDFPQHALNQFYKEVVNLVEKCVESVNEVTIKSNPRIWDFTKYIPNFDPLHIKVGDTIKTDSALNLKVDDIATHIHNELLFYENSGRIWSSTNLQKINNRKKPKINESLDISSKYEWKYKGEINHDYYLYTFTAGDREYEVKFTQHSDTPGLYERSYFPKKCDYEGKNTNEGNAVKIIATVTDITLHFLENNHFWYQILIHPIDQKRNRVVSAFLDKYLPSKYYIESDGEVLNIYHKIPTL